MKYFSGFFIPKFLVCCSSILLGLFPLKAALAVVPWPTPTSIAGSGLTMDVNDLNSAIIAYVNNPSDANFTSYVTARNNYITALEAIPSATLTVSGNETPPVPPGTPFNVMGATAALVELNPGATFTADMFNTRIIDLEDNSALVLNSPFGSNIVIKNSTTPPGVGTIFNAQSTFVGIGLDSQHDISRPGVGYTNISAAVGILENSQFIGDNLGLIGAGGAVLNSGLNSYLAIRNVRFAKNHLGQGGAVAGTVGATTTIVGSTFNNNTSTQNGGAGAFLVGTNTLIIDSSFTNNMAGMVSTAGSGGAVFTNGGSNLTINNSIFQENSATELGGAVALASSTALISDSSFTGNTAGNMNIPGLGGAISAIDSILNISNSTFQQNSATEFGGAIFSSGPNPLDITDSSFIQNTAGVNGGGAIYLEDGTPLNFTVSDNLSSEFSGNTAGGEPSSIFFAGSSDVNIDVGTNGLLDMQDPMSSINTGTITINKSGNGVWRLGGNNNFVQPIETNVNSGSLILDGQLDSNVAIAAGARLAGIGIINGDLTVNGTIAPGDFPGMIATLAVNGNYIQNPGSFYEVDINPAGASDLILVNGAATLNGGTVAVMPAPGFYKINTRYTILTAEGGRTGTYDTLTQSPNTQPFLQFALVYDPNHVFLDVVRSAVAFPDVGETQNQRNTAAGVESLGPGNRVFDAVANLATAEEARRAFDSLSGEIHVSAISVFIEESRYVREAAMNRLAQVFGPFGTNGVIETAAGDGGLQSMVAVLPEWGVWAQGFGSWGQLESNGNASTVDRSIGGAFLGVDRQFGDYIRLGLLGGYSQSNFNVGDVRDSRGISDNYYLALYGGAQWEQLRIRAGGAYTWHDLDVTRNVVFPGFVNTLTSSYGAHTAQAFAEAGYGLSWWGMGLEPFVGAAYVNVDTNRWTEQGGAAALTGKGQEDVFYTTVGARQAAPLFERAGFVVGENVLLGWRHAYNDITPESTLAFATGSIPFVIGGVPIAQNALMIDAGLDFGNPANNLNFKVSYIGQVGNDVQDHGVMGVLSWRF